jgi:thiol-disulfide isomerase/thioredoxin
MRVWLFSLMLVLMVGCSPQISSIEDEQPFYAWDFTLETIDGDAITLSEQRGKWVIINFWATWCAPCRQEMPTLQMIAEDYPDVLVLGVNLRESVETISLYREELGVTFPILINPDDQLLTDYQVIGLPQTLVVSPDGEVVMREFGIFDLVRLFDVLEGL